MKNNIFGVLQRVGRSFMLPIAILPAAGLLLGVGSSLTNPAMLNAYGLTRFLGSGTAANAIFQVMRRSGNIVFENLPILFAIGVAIGMAKREKEVAGLSAAIAFFIMHASIESMIVINESAGKLPKGAADSVCGISSLEMGVFGGILVGLGVAALHNRFYRIHLPQFLSFFGGSRFVPIISSLVYTGVGILMGFVWPPIQSGISAVGNLVLVSGYAGTWVYGLMERLLIPFGLHHVFYLPFWQTALGGSMEVAGRTVEGAQNIFFAQLADPSVQHFAVSATRFMSGKFPLMIFGLPGAALAMYHTAGTEQKKTVQGLLISAALTSMLTGITEPLEFTFLFAAPLLYGIHCILAGLSYMLMHLCGVGVGMTFSGGLIDLFLFGILPGNEKTGWLWILPVGAAYFCLYYTLFRFLILRLDLKTPGRDSGKEVRLYSRKDMEAQKKDRESISSQAAEDALSRSLLLGLGGKHNISDIDCCATRLRCTVSDPSLVRSDLLKATGASGVIQSGTGVQIVYGSEVTEIKARLEDYLEQCPETDLTDRPYPATSADMSDKPYPTTSADITDESYPAVSADMSDRPPAESANHPTAGLNAKAAMAPRDLQTDTPKASPDAVIVCSPLCGLSVDLSTVPDDVFARRMAGDGAAVIPAQPLVLAPEDGEIVYLADTSHAVGMRTDGGINLLIHIGIDTVSLNGRGFTALISKGQHVRKGEALLKLDLEFLAAHTPSMASPVLVAGLKKNQRIRPLCDGQIEAGEPLFVIETIC